jgi:hypothetical protein
MRLISIALTAVVAISLPAAGQGRLGQSQQGIPIGGGDIEHLNPSAVLLEHKKDLRLDGRQISSLDSLRKIFDRDGKALADTIRRSQRAITAPPPMTRRPPEGKPETKKDSLERAKLDSTNRVKNDRYFEEVTTGRRDLAAALLTLKDLFDSNVTAASGLLTADQRTAGVMALETAAQAFVRKLRLANVR